MIAVIGDVHGCYNTLENLTAEVEKKYPSIPLFCVGDLIDRGNFSFEVMDFIIDKNVTFTPGNHDYMFYYYMKEPSNPIGRPWIYNGSETTLRSYQGRWDRMDAHLEAISLAPLFIDHEDCFISHAGISNFYKKDFIESPLEDLEKLNTILKNNLLSEHGVLWTRDEVFKFPKIQVLGHTRQSEVVFNEKTNSLCIDTAAVANNKLSAVIMDKNKLVETISQKTIQIDIERTSF